MTFSDWMDAAHLQMKAESLLLPRSDRWWLTGPVRLPQGMQDEHAAAFRAAYHAGTTPQEYAHETLAKAQRPSRNQHNDYVAYVQISRLLLHYDRDQLITNRLVT